MRFEWDAAKNRSNIRKQGIDFADVPEVFDGPMYVDLDTKAEYGEDRWIGFRFLKGTIVIVIFGERPGQVIRIISARKARKHEREEFEKKIADQLGFFGG
jgi:hypothetical protein